MEDSLALEAIRKKLVGKRLTYDEIYAVMDEIAHKRLGDVLTTYFAASGYSKGFTNEEIYYLTKAMVETGEQLHFKGIVADKHSIGGISGTRTTMIVVPIIAAAGFTIPKSSSRAITTPGGTADDMEVLAPVVFTKEQIYKIVEKTNGCIVWGGSVNIAPADDVIINVEAPLSFESFDKVLVSIMAKKIAFGSNHVIIDLPYGELVKVHTLSDAEKLKGKFEQLARRFNMTLKVLLHKTEQPAGRGIGPLLETREALRVLEQHQDRPIDLENRALELAGTLLDLCLKDSNLALQARIKREFGNGTGWAKSILTTGRAHDKIRDIIKAQGGNADISADMLQPGRHQHKVLATQSGVVKKIQILNSTSIAKVLGAPKEKTAGIYLNKKIGETVDRHAILCTLYSDSQSNLIEAIDSLHNLPLFTVE